MAFRMHCDRCLAFMTNVTAAKFKDLQASAEVVCNNCKAAEEKLGKAIVNVKKQIDGKIREIEREIKASLNKEMARVVEEVRKIEGG